MSDQMNKNMSILIFFEYWNYESLLFSSALFVAQIT